MIQFVDVNSNRDQRPCVLVKTISCKDASEARRLEYNLKRLTRKEKIVALDFGIAPEH